MLDFIPEYPKEDPTFNPEIIPKDLDIFFRNEASFLPEGKTLADLTPEEKAEMQGRYRFDPLRPGIPQSISGITNKYTGRGGIM
jgi:hypothetical protein